MIHQSLSRDGNVADTNLPAMLVHEDRILVSARPDVGVSIVSDVEGRRAVLLASYVALMLSASEKLGDTGKYALAVELVTDSEASIVCVGDMG